MANAVDAVGQEVDEEAADELVRRRPHGLVAARAFDPVHWQANFRKLWAVPKREVVADRTIKAWYRPPIAWA
jgi:hypothetical protein